MLTFHSVDLENNKVLYHTEYVKKENTYIFQDKSTSNTTIYLTLEDDKILFIRKGEIEMSMTLSLQEKYVGFYKNNMGLSFEFYTETKTLKTEKNRIEIEYSLFMGEDLITAQKIWILIH